MYMIFDICTKCTKLQITERICQNDLSVYKVHSHLYVTLHVGTFVRTYKLTINHVRTCVYIHI